MGINIFKQDEIVKEKIRKGLEINDREYQRALLIQEGKRRREEIRNQFIRNEV